MQRLEDPELRWTDYAFVTCNKLVTVAYVVYAATSIRAAEWVAWGAKRWRLWGRPRLTLPGCSPLGCYDLIYVPFHRLLHVPALPPYTSTTTARRCPFVARLTASTRTRSSSFGEFLRLGSAWPSVAAPLLVSSCRKGPWHFSSRAA